MLSESPPVSDSSASVSVPGCESFAHKLYLNACVPNEEEQMDDKIQQNNSDVGVAKTLTGLGLRDVVA